MEQRRGRAWFWIKRPRSASLEPRHDGRHHGRHTSPHSHLNLKAAREPGLLCPSSQPSAKWLPSLPNASMKARGKSVIFPQETLSNPLPVIQFSLTVETVVPFSVCSQLLCVLTALVWMPTPGCSQESVWFSVWVHTHSSSYSLGLLHCPRRVLVGMEGSPLIIPI